MLLRISVLLLSLMVAACDSDINQPDISLKIYTSGLGAESDAMPQEIIELWAPLDVRGKQIVPGIELMRIDRKEVITLDNLAQGFDFIPPDPVVKLDREKEALKTKKIDQEFSIKAASDITLARNRIAKYHENDVFYLQSSLSKAKSYDTPSQVLDALKDRISHNDNAHQEYIIVYKLVDMEWLQANEAEIAKLVSSALASKRTAETAAMSASKALERAQSDLNSAKKIAIDADNEASQAHCNKADDAAAQVRSMLQKAESYLASAGEAVKQAEASKQAASRAADSAAQVGVDKPVAENAVKAGAAAVSAAEKAQQAAEVAASKVAEGVKNALVTKQRIPTLCHKDKEGDVIKTPKPSDVVKKPKVEKPKEKDELDKVKQETWQELEKLKENYIKRSR